MSVLQCVAPYYYRSLLQNSLFYRAFLQKRPIILRSLLIVATPYVCGSYMQPQCLPSPLLMCVCVLLNVSRYRVAYSHRMPYLYRSFSAKEPYN